MAKPKLSDDLERSVLYAVIHGLVNPGVVSAEELSKQGRVVLAAIKALNEGGHRAPFSPKSVWVTCTDVLGGDRGLFRDYVKTVLDSAAGVEVEEILRRVRHRQRLVDVVNEASAQLTDGNLNPVPFLDLLKPDTADALTPLASVLDNGLPKAPSGPPIKTLPALSEKCGGMFGVWALAGEPGVGKSTLAWQLSLDLGRTVPVLYYDFENGRDVLLYHAAEVFDGDVDRIRRLTTDIYYRDTIRTLDSDISMVKAPALIVVDSVQKLPSSITYRREGLDQWVHRFENLKKQGYTVLLVSEMPRLLYGQEPSLRAFKETGEIEYSADFGLQMIEQGGYVRLFLVKNRHFPYRGHAVTLKRVRSWWFEEI